MTSFVLPSVRTLRNTTFDKREREREERERERREREREREKIEKIERIQLKDYR